MKIQRENSHLGFRRNLDSNPLLIKVFLHIFIDNITMNTFQEFHSFEFQHLHLAISDYGFLNGSEKKTYPKNNVKRK